jgi:hypothetical protein
MKKVLQYFQSAPSPPFAGSARLTSTARDIYTRPIIHDPSELVTCRISFDASSIRIYGYPSRGGVIILEDASPPDLDFLELDRTDPPMHRHDGPAEEDMFCQRLLLLGAKWWERYWVSVAWPSSGGLVVSEFDTTIWGVEIGDIECVPDDVARLRLCKNMDEKAQMPKDRFKGETWESVGDYTGNAFIGCGVQKTSGEVGEFEKTW